MRLRPLIAVLTVALAATVLVGCSRKAERLVGADRLIRGPGGLGTTTRVIETPDRDTYVENGTAVFDSMLLVGQSAGFEARTFLLIGTVNLPDTTLPGFVPQILSLEFQRNLTLGFDPTTVNAFQTTVWDTTTVSWAGPAPGVLLGSAADDRVLTGFSLPLNSTSFTQVVQWKVNPVVTPPRIELQTGGQPLAAYVAGTVKLRIRYSHTVSGSAVLDSIDSPVTQDFYLHSPLSPAPSGADSALVWGGIYQTEIAMHFPLDSIPSSVSVNEATLVLRVLSNTALPDSADVSARVFVKAIRSSWGEGVSEQSSIPGVDSTAFASGSLIALYSVANGTVAIRLPGSLMREWVATPSTNGGLLVRLDDHRNLTKRFLIGSRESTQPAELHVSYTELPPGRL
jgi:hypothetical protein